MICDNCKQEADRLYDLVLFACGLRLSLCEKCFRIATGKEASDD